MTTTQSGKNEVAGVGSSPELLPPGEYRVEIKPETLHLQTEGKAEKVRFTLLIIEGPYTGRDVPVSVWIEAGGQARLARSVEDGTRILTAWARAVGCEGAEDVLGLLWDMGSKTSAANGVLVSLAPLAGRNGGAFVNLVDFIGRGDGDVQQ